MKQAVPKHLLPSQDLDTLMMRAQSSLETSGSDYPVTQRIIPEYCNLQTKSAFNFNIRRRSIRSKARCRNFQSRSSQKPNTLRCAWMGASSKVTTFNPRHGHDEMYLQTKNIYLTLGVHQMGISSGSSVGVILGYLYPHPEYTAHGSSALHIQSRNRF